MAIQLGVLNAFQNNYKICPECGRIYLNEKNTNFCPKCTKGGKLITIKVVEVNE